MIEERLAKEAKEAKAKEGKEKWPWQEAGAMAEEAEARAKGVQNPEP